MPDFWRSMFEDRKDERFVEYQYVWRNLQFPLPPWRTVLDVGSLDSTLSVCLTKLGYEAIGIDTREPPEPQSYTLEKQDIRKTNYSNDRFDQIIAVSTIEHVGLNAYSNKLLETHGDRKAILEIKRILRPEGNFILTVPYTQHQNDYWIRYYQKQSLLSLVEGLKILDVSIFYKGAQGWDPAMFSDPVGIGTGKGGIPNGVACLRLSKDD